MSILTKHVCDPTIVPDVIANDIAVSTYMVCVLLYTYAQHHNDYLAIHLLCDNRKTYKSNTKHISTRLAIGCNQIK
jgi:hypothetical protein